MGVEPWLQGYGYSSEPYKSYDSMIAYGQSKTANLLFTTYLAKHLASEGITSLTLHPGGIFSNPVSEPWIYGQVLTVGQ